MNVYMYVCTGYLGMYIFVYVCMHAFLMLRGVEGPQPSQRPRRRQMGAPPDNWSYLLRRIAMTQEREKVFVGGEWNGRRGYISSRETEGCNRTQLRYAGLGFA